MQEQANDQIESCSRRSFLGVDMNASINANTFQESGRVLEPKNTLLEQPQISINGLDNQKRENRGSLEEIYEIKSKMIGSCNELSPNEGQYCEKKQGLVRDNKEQHNSFDSQIVHRRNGVSQDKGFIKKSKFNDLIFEVRMKNKARKLANSTQSRMQKNITLNQLAMIGDKIFDHSQSKQENYYENTKNERNSIIYKKSTVFFLFQKMNLFLPVFDPRGKFKIIFEVINMFAVFLIFWLLSIVIAFKEEIEEIASPLWIYVSLGILCANAFINLNTGFYQAGILIKDRQKMLQSYKDIYFWSDIIAFGSILSLLFLDNIQFHSRDSSHNSFSDNENSDAVSFLKITLFLPFYKKIRDFSKFTQTFEEKVIFHQKAQNYIQLAKLFSNIVFIEHIVACLWIFQAKLSMNEQVNWQISKQFQFESWERQYTLAFYYSTVTMTTVGYGDITPTNQTEYVFSTILIIVSSGLFAFTLNQIGAIFTEFSAEEKETRRKFNIINMQMEKRNVGQTLRTQIREYLDYVWRENDEKFAKDSESIINQLNDSLKRELQLNQNKKILDYLKGHYSQKFIEKATTLIEEFSCKPQQIIFNQGENTDTCLYLVEKGSAEIFTKIKAIKQTSATDHILSEIKEGQLFGVRQFYTGNYRDLNVRAVGFSNLLRIKREDFLALLQDFPEDQEMFCYIRDRMILLNDHQKSSSICPSCNSTNHNLVDCPYLHYIPNHENLMLKHSYEPKNGKQYQRRTLLEVGAKERKEYKWNSYYDIKPSLQQYIMENFEDLEEYQASNFGYNFNYSFIFENSFKRIEDEDDDNGFGCSLLDQNKNNNSGNPYFNNDSQINFIQQPQSFLNDGNNFFKQDNREDILEEQYDMYQNQNHYENHEQTPMRQRAKSKRKDSFLPQPSFQRGASSPQQSLFSPKPYSQAGKSQFTTDTQEKFSFDFSKANEQKDISQLFSNMINAQYQNEEEQNLIRKQKRQRTTRKLSFNDSKLQQLIQNQFAQVQKSSFSPPQSQHPSKNYQTLNSNPKSLYQRTFSRTFSAKMKVLQQSILDKLSKVINKGGNTQNNHALMDSNSDIQIDEGEDFQQRQQVFRYFDKQKNYDVYFPFHNLTYIVLKLQQKSQHVLNAYLDNLLKKKKQFNPSIATLGCTSRNKIDKNLQKSDRIKTNMTLSAVPKDNPKRRQALMDKSLQLDSPQSSIFSDNNLLFSPEKGNINSATQINLISKKVTSVNNLVSKNELSLNDIDIKQQQNQSQTAQQQQQEQQQQYQQQSHQIQQQQDSSPNLNDSEKEKDMNQINTFEIEKKGYFQKIYDQQ